LRFPSRCGCSSEVSPRQRRGKRTENKLRAIPKGARSATYIWS
jgi:hypothetical protein